MGRGGKADLHDGKHCAGRWRPAVDLDVSIGSPILSCTRLKSPETVHSQEQRDLAAVMEIVFDRVVDAPTARYFLHLTIPFVREGFGALFRRPAV